MRQRLWVLSGLLVGLIGTVAFATDPPGSPADPFMLYKTKVTKDTPAFVPPVAPVTLTDAYETNIQYLVKKTADLGLPADKASEGIVDAVTHLQAYKIKTTGPKFVTVTNNKVIDVFTPPNQNFALLVDIGKPDFLLVPTAKDLVNPNPTAPNPTMHNVDNYKCYKVKVTKDTPKFDLHVIAVADQFANLQNPAADPNPKQFDVKKPKHLCVPVNMNGGGIKNAVGRLMCYSVKLHKTDPAQLKHTSINPIYINNTPFGALNLTSKKEDELCVPALAGTVGVCGNNTLDFGEACDGTAPSPCPGACSSLCTCPVNFNFDIDPSNSQATMKGLFGLNSIVPLTGLSGTVQMSVGQDVIPNSGVLQIKVLPVALPPLTVFGLATACPYLVDDGSGFAGTGYVDCSGFNLTGQPGYPASPDIRTYIDHVVDGPNDSYPNSGASCLGVPGVGSEMDTDTGVCVPDGAPDPGCALGSLDAVHAGVCNGNIVGPVGGTTPWTIAGHAIVNFNFAIEIVQPPGPCTGVPTVGPVAVPGTTGTTISAIMDAFPGQPPSASGKTQALVVAGTAFNCQNLLNGGSITGTKLVGTFPILDVSILGPAADVNAGLEFQAQ
jgi:hypothetical protein